jgi:hypothetical protein
MGKRRQFERKREQGFHQTPTVSPSVFAVLILFLDSYSCLLTSNPVPGSGRETWLLEGGQGPALGIYLVRALEPFFLASWRISSAGSDR